MKKKTKKSKKKTSEEIIKEDPVGVISAYKHLGLNITHAEDLGDGRILLTGTCKSRSQGILYDED